VNDLERKLPIAGPGAGEVVVRPALVPAVVSSPTPGGGRLVVPTIGLQLPRQLPFETWLGLGLQLSAAATSSAWCLGDWLAYGQRAYAGRYRDAVELTGLDYQTLRNYAWVARAYEPPRRREALSFGHHAEVASLPVPEQEFWSRKAEQLGWPTGQLRRQVRASLRERQVGQSATEPAEPGQPGPGPCAGPAVTVRVRLTPQQAQRCQQAAARQGLTVPAWAAQILIAVHDTPERATDDQS
jgi:hypothetical protein